MDITIGDIVGGVVILIIGVIWFVIKDEQLDEE